MYLPSSAGERAHESTIRHRPVGACRDISDLADLDCGTEGGLTTQAARRSPVSLFARDSPKTALPTNPAIRLS